MRNHTEFDRFLQIQLLSRLHTVSLFVIMLGAYFFYADFFLFKDLGRPSYRMMLITVHSAGFLGSILYVLFYQFFKDNGFTQSRWSALLINAYVFLYLLAGAISSINNLRFTGNIDPYLILLTFTAVLFPLKPMHFTFSLVTNHLVFLIGLSIFTPDRFALVGKQINSSVTAAAALLIVVTFYNMKKNDFMMRLKLKQSEMQFRRLFNVNPYPLILTRLEDGKILLINEKAREFFQISPDEIDQTGAQIFYKNEEDRLQVAKRLSETGRVKNVLLARKRAEDDYQWIHVNYESAQYENESCVLIGVSDITDLKRIEQELLVASTTDPLTGIMNRRSGMSHLQNRMSESNKENQEFTLCFVDVNNLKLINDKYGHPQGDAWIYAISSLIHNNLSPDDIVFRYGGDEFIIVFNTSDKRIVNGRWERIQEAFEFYNRQKKLPYSISVSKGFYTHKPGMRITIQELIDLADKEMYKEKSISKRPKIN